MNNEIGTFNQWANLRSNAVMAISIWDQMDVVPSPRRHSIAAELAYGVSTALEAHGGCITNTDILDEIKARVSKYGQDYCWNRVEVFHDRHAECKHLEAAAYEIAVSVLCLSRVSTNLDTATPTTIT